MWSNINVLFDTKVLIFSAKIGKQFAIVWRVYGIKFCRAHVQ